MKRDYYSGFFFNPHELTKIVLQKFYKILLHQIALFGLANWTKKVFPVFPRNIPYPARPKGPPSNFFQHCETFFPGIFFLKGSPFNFLLFCDRMDVGKSHSPPPFSFFGTVRFFSENKNFPPFNFWCFATKPPQLRQKCWQFRKCPLSARQGAPVRHSVHFFEYVIFSKKIFVKLSIFEYCKREYLTLGSLFAIFEPWIWRRLRPVPACFSSLWMVQFFVNLFQSFQSSDVTFSKFGCNVFKVRI